MSKKKDNVKIVRLTTGEELICEAIETDGGWTVSKALLLVPVSLQNMQMIPWLAYAKHPEKGLFLPEKIIAFTVEAEDRLKAEYEKAFSKIIAPSNELLTGAGMGDISNKLRLST